MNRYSLCLVLVAILSGNLCLNCSAAEGVTGVTPAAIEPLDHKAIINLPTVTVTLPEDKTKQSQLSELKGMAASLEVEEVQSVLSRGLSLTVNISNSGDEDITIDNPLDSLRISLSSENVEVVTPRALRVGGDDDITQFFTGRGKKKPDLILGFKVISIARNAKPILENEWKKSSMNFPAHSEIRFDLRVETFFSKPEWMRKDPFTQPTIDRPPVSAKLRPVQENSLAAGLYRVRVSITLLATTGALIIGSDLKGTADSLVVLYLDDKKTAF